jgi:hypothetical protein
MENNNTQQPPSSRQKRITGSKQKPKTKTHPTADLTQGNLLIQGFNPSIIRSRGQTPSVSEASLSQTSTDPS